MWNHAITIVEDILNKMKQVSQAMIESVQPIPTVSQISLVRGHSIMFSRDKSLYNHDLRTVLVFISINSVSISKLKNPQTLSKWQA